MTSLPPYSRVLLRLLQRGLGRLVVASRELLVANLRPLHRVEIAEGELGGNRLDVGDGIDLAVDVDDVGYGDRKKKFKKDKKERRKRRRRSSLRKVMNCKQSKIRT